MIASTRYKEAAILALQEPEQLCLRVWYIDSSGDVTERVVSPVRLTRAGMLVYCLGREDIRLLLWRRLVGMKFQLTSEVLAPEAIQILVEQRKRPR